MPPSVENAAGRTKSGLPQAFLPEEILFIASLLVDLAMKRAFRPAISQRRRYLTHDPLFHACAPAGYH
ncbi:hypothetical protein EGK14_12005 [Erwinia sp. 198]|nr:hypothetical protein EGK14_12005 [Erwinia sp. 198]